MVTGRQYADQALKVYNQKPQAGYIYGETGRTWTAELQKALEDKYNRTRKSDLKLGAEYGSKWIGHAVYDCSGLTSKCAERIGLKFHHGSNSSYIYDCQAKGKKTPDMKLPVGAWVYTGTEKDRGHIGIVVSDTEVVEAQGTKTGVVKSKLSLKKWTWWGLGRGIIFDFTPGGAVTSVTNVAVPAENDSSASKIPSYPTIRKGAKGDLVVQLQRALMAAGYDLPKYGADGDFGNETLEVVKRFQQNRGLTVDGVVGPKTWKELLGR